MQTFQQYISFRASNTFHAILKTYNAYETPENATEKAFKQFIFIISTQTDVHVDMNISKKYIQ